MAAWNEPSRVIVQVVGSTEPCGCVHCSAFDLGAGNLVQETHVGVGENRLAAVNDALRQAYEKHPNGELSVEHWKELAVV